MNTLGRQLLTGISVIFVLGLVGIGSIYVLNAQTYLQEQLQAHAEDTATSLGLSIGLHAEDASFAETAINATFDRGYFEEILYLSASGERIVEKKLPTADLDVPAWFVKVLPLHAPTASSFVTKGWKQAGKIAVTSNTRFAYLQLYKTGMATLGWMLIILAVAVLAMKAFLAGILRPLHEVEASADAIGHRDFREITLQPHTRELAQVVKAMNALSAKVRDAISTETARAESLRKEVFIDAVTGTWNRRGLEQQVEVRLRGDKNVYCAFLALLEFNEFAEFNRSAGYARADEFLREATAIMEAVAKDSNAIVGRMAGATFAIAGLNVEQTAVRELIANLCARMSAMLSEQGLRETLPFSCGAGFVDGDRPALKTLLAGADGALTQARAAGAGQFELRVVDAAGDGEMGSMQWRDRLQAALDAGHIALFGQKALTLPHRTLFHTELMVRLTDDTIPAARFLPMAARHKLLPRIDRIMVERLLGLLRSGAIPQQHFAINISAQSVADAGFVQWLATALAQARAHAGLLTFEMTEAGAMAEPELTVMFAQGVRKAGAGFGLDNFGALPESFKTLQRLLPDYVKLAASYTGVLNTDQSTRFYVESAVRVAHSLDIRVVALAVETEDVVVLLEKIGMGGFQGFLIGRPEPLVASGNQPG